MSRVIAGGDADQFPLWTAPVVGGGYDPADPHSRPSTGRLATAGEVGEIHQQAHEEGFAEGYKAGIEKGQADMQSKIARIDALLRAFDAPLLELDDAAVQAMMELAGDIACHLVRRELRIDPNEVVGIVREAIAAVPDQSRHVRVRLNPEDAGIVREALRLNEAQSPWSIVEDPAIDRGGCEILTDSSRVDSSLRGRLNAILGALVSEEREGDQPSG